MCLPLIAFNLALGEPSANYPGTSGHIAGALALRSAKRVSREKDLVPDHFLGQDPGVELLGGYQSEVDRGLA
jgi:hypothetical protein